MNDPKLLQALRDAEDELAWATADAHVLAAVYIGCTADSSGDTHAKELLDCKQPVCVKRVKLGRRLNVLLAEAGY